MPRKGRSSGLEQLSVYATEEEKAIIDLLAEMENRSVSNLLKTLALQKAREKGIVKEGTK